VPSNFDSRSRPIRHPVAWVLLALRTCCCFMLITWVHVTVICNRQAIEL
jgi:hypothetical protein